MVMITLSMSFVPGIMENKAYEWIFNYAHAICLVIGKNWQFCRFILGMMMEFWNFLFSIEFCGSCELTGCCVCLSVHSRSSINYTSCDCALGFQRTASEYAHYRLPYSVSRSII